MPAWGEATAATRSHTTDLICTKAGWLTPAGLVCNGALDLESVETAMSDKFDTLFLDTNIFLQFAKLDQIDWPAIAADSPVDLVVCMQVIHELDRQKSDPRLKDRARDAIKTIDEFAVKRMPLRPAVQLEIFNHEVRREDFPAELSPDQGDDILLRLFEEYRGRNPAKRIGLVTDDLGARVRAGSRGIKTVQLPEKYRRADPVDEQTKKMRELQRTNAQLQDRLPVLGVVLEGDGIQRSLPNLMFNLRLRRLCAPIDHDSEAARLKAKFPPMCGRVEQHGMMALMGLPKIGGHDYERYNRDLIVFYENFQRYLQFCVAYQSVSHRIFELDVMLLNSGRGPANDVAVRIHFPTQIHRIGLSGSLDNRIPSRPKPPSPPQLRRWDQSMHLGLGHLNIPTIVPISEQIRRAANHELPESDVVRDDEALTHTLSSTIKRTVHQRNYRLGNVIGVFAEDFDFRPIELPFCISTADHPDLTEGVLVVRPEIVDDPTPLVQMPSYESALE
jgi:hypothetical protein